MARLPSAHATSTSKSSAPGGGSRCCTQDRSGDYVCGHMRISVEAGTVCMPSCCGRSLVTVFECSTNLFSVDLVARSVAILLTEPEHKKFILSAIRDIVREEASGHQDADLATKYGTLSIADTKSSHTVVESETDAGPGLSALADLSLRTLKIVQGLPTETIEFGDRKITYFLPKEGAKAPYYCIGRGLAVGIFTNW